MEKPEGFPETQRVQGWLSLTWHQGGTEEDRVGPGGARGCSSEKQPRTLQPLKRVRTWQRTLRQAGRHGTHSLPPGWCRSRCRREPRRRRAEIQRQTEKTPGPPRGRRPSARSGSGSHQATVCRRQGENMEEASPATHSALLLFPQCQRGRGQDTGPAGAWLYQVRPLSCCS